MPDNVEPLLDWLKRLRRINLAQLGLVDSHFDLDGALAAGQPELAWRTRSVMLVSGIELYLRQCGLDPAAGADHAERVQIMLRHLAMIDSQLAQEAWDLLLQAAPVGTEAMRREIAAAGNFLRDRLSVQSASSRGAAIRVWAEGARLVREIGRILGAAGSGSWYLPEAPVPGAGAEWYDEVISLVSRQA